VWDILLEVWDTLVTREARTRPGSETRELSCPAPQAYVTDHETTELGTVDIRAIRQPTQLELNRRILKNMVHNFWKRNSRFEAAPRTTRPRHSEQVSQAKLSKAFR